MVRLPQISNKYEILTDMSIVSCYHDRCNKSLMRLAVGVEILIKQEMCYVIEGNVPNGNWNRGNEKLNLNRNNPDNQNENWGSPSTVRIYVLCCDFNQPPSILPTSASVAWVWNIFVSLAILFSNTSRNFKVVTSK